MLFSAEQLHSFLANYGYWGVAFFVGLEGMGIPLPGETVLILASAYAGDHNGNIGLVIAFAAAGAIVGDNIGYFLGRELGARFLRRFGPSIGLTAARLRLGQYLFNRHGMKVVFIARFIALLRFLGAFLAGANRMAWSRFAVANALGATSWAAIVGLAAYSFGKELHRMSGPLGVVAIVVATGALAWILLYVRRHEAEMQAEADRAIPDSGLSIR